MAWGVKAKTNDEVRQEFIDETVPEVHALGLTFPDRDLRYDDESDHWVTGPIDWEEFWRVVKGGGPLNRERLAARQDAHSDGQWVREAMVAYAAKTAALV